MTTTANGKTVTVLGINGHIGQHAARAFAQAGWQVTGFGRSNKTPIPGVRFFQGDANSVSDMAAAIAEADVVVNALNLPYAEWDNGRAEAQVERVIAAMGKSGKTMLFPGNIYNYAASDRVITPDMAQHPETPRGAIRVRIEAMLKAAAERGDMQVIILRAGDFYAEHSKGDWYEYAILREAGKGKVARIGQPDTVHAWAYLPDLGRAFEKLAWHRGDLAGFENFHFAGHAITHGQLLAAVQAAAPWPLKVVEVPWALFGALGLFSPMLREVLKMRYLWNNSMELSDPRLDAILGPDFATPYEVAIGRVVEGYLPAERVAA